MFCDANRYLRERNYEKAIAIYKKILRTKEAPLTAQINFNLELALKKLNNHHGNFLYGFTVKNTHGLKQKTKNGWLSLNDDPHLYLEPHEIFSEGAGWYVFKVNINSNRRHAIKFYLDMGKGLCEENTVTIHKNTNQNSSRIFKVKKTPLQARFDPCDVKVDFAINAFSIWKLTEAEAINSMLEQLIATKKEFSAFNTNQVLQKIQWQAKEANKNWLDHLHETYDASFVEKYQTPSYQDWMENIEAPSLPTKEQIQQTLATSGNTPLISILMPVYNTEPGLLKECINSVLSQSWPHWEFCIADDKSPDPQIKQILHHYSQQDSRIRVVYRQENGHISRASNSALELVGGEYTALLDHDDLLPEHALFFIAKSINERPSVQIIYSDEDKVDMDGNRHSPHFKSDWNPDLFFSQNYVSHFGVYKTELLKKIKGFRTGVEGSQDQDLLLRCLPHVKNEEIIHIPRILYHWRMVPGSTALASGEKSYTTEAGIKALRDYFDANGPDGVIVEAGKVANTYHVRWPIPNPEPLVSLLIPTRDKKEITQLAVESILEKTTYQNYEIIILDNGSVEPKTLKWFENIKKKDSRVRVIRYDQPFNYSAINNFGVRQAKGSIIGLVNNDVEVISPDWLTEMLGHVCRKEIGCVGAKLYYGNDTLQHGGVIVSLGGVAGHSHKHFPRNSSGYFHRLKIVQNLSAVTAACLLVRKEVYQQVSGLDEENLKIAFNDVDFCLKVREAGYRNLWTPYAELYHHESISRGHENTPEKKARFAKEVNFMKNKWNHLLKIDPYYNRNLSTSSEKFEIARS